MKIIPIIAWIAKKVVLLSRIILLLGCFRLLLVFEERYSTTAFLLIKIHHRHDKVTGIRDIYRNHLNKENLHISPNKKHLFNSLISQESQNKIDVIQVTLCLSSSQIKQLKNKITPSIIKRSSRHDLQQKISFFLSSPLSFTS